MAQSIDATTIRSSSVTLKFKYLCYTFLIYATPHTPFKTIKSHLLEAISEQYPDGLPVERRDEFPDRPVIALPESIEEIRVGVLRDPFDVNKGWEEINTDGRETPEGLNVVDGAMLTFSFSRKGEEFGEDMFEVLFPDQDELYPDEEMES